MHFVPWFRGTALHLRVDDAALLTSPAAEAEAEAAKEAAQTLMAEACELFPPRESMDLDSLTVRVGAACCKGPDTLRTMRLRHHKASHTCSCLCFELCAVSDSR